LLDQFRHDLETMEAALTRFHPDSELSHLNRHSGTWVEVSPLLFEVLQAAHQAALLTEGMFNPLVLPALIASGYDRSFELLQTPVRQPTHPAGDWQQMKLRLRTREVYLPEGSALDLGGIGKGWAADKFASQLAEYGAVLVNIGGDIAARGQPEGQPGWLVDVSEPGAETIFTTITLTDGGIVTTALDYRHWMTSDGQQQHHIIDPRTGQPARTDVYSVTIRHPRATLAEAFAKAVMLRGSQAGLGWLSQQWDTAALVVRNDGAVLATSNWQ
ncbi:MAG TPA: FAD:protein FMN transferase, partial [Phototrophicaceae bacterium]|nr:FAD:protein FMN transferase [Phototrophicaceae bacterium]